MQNIIATYQKLGTQCQFDHNMDGFITQLDSKKFFTRQGHDPILVSVSSASVDVINS